LPHPIVPKKYPRGHTVDTLEEGEAFITVVYGERLEMSTGGEYLVCIVIVVCFLYVYVMIGKNCDKMPILFLNNLLIAFTPMSCRSQSPSSSRHGPTRRRTQTSIQTRRQRRSPRRSLLSQRSHRGRIPNATRRLYSTQRERRKLLPSEAIAFYNPCLSIRRGVLHRKSARGGVCSILPNWI
jgi:hypothetical protein